MVYNSGSIFYGNLFVDEYSAQKVEEVFSLVEPVLSFYNLTGFDFILEVNFRMFSQIGL
jgi:hypothetical protein